jgi:hypothetical protein
VFQQDVACVSIRGFKCFSSSNYDATMHFVACKPVALWFSLATLILSTPDIFYDKLSFKPDNRHNVKRSCHIRREHLEIMKLIGKTTDHTPLDFIPNSLDLMIKESNEKRICTIRLDEDLIVYIKYILVRTRIYYN